MSEGNFLPEILDGLVTGSIRLNEAPQGHSTSGRGTEEGNRPIKLPSCEGCGRPSQKALCDKCSGDNYESLRF